MRGPPAQRLVFTLAIAALFLAAQLSTFGHLLFQRHVACAHGELIHVDESPAHPVVAPTEEPELAYRAGPNVASSHAHDHCLTCIAGRERLMSVSPASGLVLAPVSKDVAGAARGPCAPAPVALLRLAPKSSPPA